VDSLNARGLVFPYRVSGPAAGREVLLLHGFPQFSREWRNQQEALALAGLRAVAPDQRGYAPRNRPAEVEAYRMDELVADVIGMLDALGWPRADLVGHDWGGAVAWHVAGRHPERIRTLTAVSTPHPLAISKAMRSGGPQRAMSSYMVGFREAGTAEDRLLADDAALLRSLYDGLPESDCYVAHFQDRAALTGGLNWYRAMSRADSEGMGMIQVPTLFVSGEGDPAFSQEAAAGTAEFVDAPYTFVVVDGGGHWLPEANADVVNEALLAHLLRHPA
jgi:pimeloyl-ACP methyl ester carboxylesterase